MTRINEYSNKFTILLGSAHQILFKLFLSFLSLSVFFFSPFFFFFSIAFNLRLTARQKEKFAWEAFDGFVKVEDNSTSQTMVVNFTSGTSYQMALLQPLNNHRRNFSLKQTSLCLPPDNHVQDLKITRTLRLPHYRDMEDPCVSRQISTRPCR